MLFLARICRPRTSLYQRFLQDFKTCRSRFPFRGKSLPQTQRKRADSCLSLMCCKSLLNLLNCMPQIQHTCQTPVQRASFSTSVSMKHGLGGSGRSSAISFSIQTKSSRSSAFQNSPVCGGKILCIARSSLASPSKSQNYLDPVFRTVL